MCDYCDCRSLEAIADLSDDHAQLERLAAKVRTGIDAAAKVEAFAELTELLRSHTAKEEHGLFAELLAEQSMVDHVARLFDDHTAIWRAIDHLALLDVHTAEWDRAVGAVLDALAAHVWVEEYDIFPASVVGLSTDGWNKLSAAAGRREEAA